MAAKWMSDTSRARISDRWTNPQGLRLNIFLVLRAWRGGTDDHQYRKTDTWQGGMGEALWRIARRCKSSEDIHAVLDKLSTHFEKCAVGAILHINAWSRSQQRFAISRVKQICERGKEIDLEDNVAKGPVRRVRCYKQTRVISPSLVD
jgi:hypothetical protein